MEWISLNGVQTSEILYVDSHVLWKKIYKQVTDEDPSLRIESFAIINLRGVSTTLN